MLDVTEPDAGAGVEFVRCDLSDSAAIDRAVEQLPQSAVSLINVAGIANAKEMATVVAVNFLGLRQITEAYASRLSKGGSIVNVASSAGRDWPDNHRPVRGLLDTPDYASGLRWLEDNRAEWIDNPYKFSKQCAAAYTYRAVALGVKRGLRVNCVNPGAIETRLTPEFRELIGADMFEWIGQQVGRFGTPAEVAEVIEFLAVGECGWLNGVEITVDGGYYAGIVGGWIQPETSPAATEHKGPSAAPAGGAD